MNKKPIFERYTGNILETEIMYRYKGDDTLEKLGIETEANDQPLTWHPSKLVILPNMITAWSYINTKNEDLPDYFKPVLYLSSGSWVLNESMEELDTFLTSLITTYYAPKQKPPDLHFYQITPTFGDTEF